MSKTDVNAIKKVVCKYEGRFMNKYDKSVKNIFNIKKRYLCFSNNKTENEIYGIAYSLLKYMDENYRELCITCPIEHGLSITNKFAFACENTNISNYLITNSSYREDILKTITKKNIIKVGPYIAYAEGVFTEERLSDEKKRNGRTLLVFPTHGIKGFTPKFEMGKFINRIEEIKTEFDTVIVCMYFYDILCNRHKPYIDMGYRVVSAGNAHNICFLDKLKTIIQLCDAVIANAYTTGLQYAVYLDKPIYLVPELNLKWENTSSNNVDKLDTELQDLNNLEELYDLCSDPLFGNLNEQKKWGRYMFGLDCVKNSKDLKNLLIPVIRRVE